jgi:hypothetical protein
MVPTPWVLSERAKALYMNKNERRVATTKVKREINAHV